MNQQKLPNATAVLILGIVSILGCCCYGVLGLIAGIIGLVLYNKDKALYLQDPSLYGNYSNLNTGRILCIIGIVMSILYLILNIALISTFGWETLQDQELMQERIREMFGQ